ncbi:MAG: hypothetical protein L3J07_01525 [Candidatus Magasanikbacteria bacterium]|nr:hypothetical protein [Candidatus Magasanikbacteria bacterium]
MYNVSGVFLRCEGFDSSSKVLCLVLYFEDKNDIKLFFIYSSLQGNSVLNSFSDSELSIFDKTVLKKRLCSLPNSDSINILGILSGASAKTTMTLIWRLAGDYPNKTEKPVLN